MKPIDVEMLATVTGGSRRSARSSGRYAGRYMDPGTLMMSRFGSDLRTLAINQQQQQQQATTMMLVAMMASKMGNFA